MSARTPRVWAIGDVHLSAARPKPMDVFGDHWRGHADRIARAWRDRVAGADIVLVAGDTSWAMKPDEARPDLAWLSALPGKKILVRGNHDYWWTTPAKLRRLAPELHFVQNNAITLDGVTVGGARLWDWPDVRWPAAPAAATEAPPADGADAPEKKAGGQRDVPDPEKIRARERERLAMSLARLEPSAHTRIALVHFPPIGADGQPTELTRMLDAYHLDACVFGHIHGAVAPAPDGGPPPGADGRLGKTRYLLASCDQVGFAPVLVLGG